MIFAPILLIRRSFLLFFGVLAHEFFDGGQFGTHSADAQHDEEQGGDMDPSNTTGRWSCW